MIADSSLTSEPEVRGPMAADGNSERLNGRVSTVLTAGKLLVTFHFVVASRAESSTNANLNLHIRLDKKSSSEFVWNDNFVFVFYLFKLMCQFVKLLPFSDMHFKYVFSDICRSNLTLLTIGQLVLNKTGESQEREAERRQTLSNQKSLGMPEICLSMGSRMS